MYTHISSSKVHVIILQAVDEHGMTDVEHFVCLAKYLVGQ